MGETVATQGYIRAGESINRCCGLVVSPNGLAELFVERLRHPSSSLSLHPSRHLGSATDRQDAPQLVVVGDCGRLCCPGRVTQHRYVAWSIMAASTWIRASSHHSQAEHCAEVHDAHEWKSRPLAGPAEAHLPDVCFHACSTCSTLRMKRPASAIPLAPAVFQRCFPPQGICFQKQHPVPSRVPKHPSLVGFDRRPHPVKVRLAGQSAVRLQAGLVHKARLLVLVALQTPRR